MDFALLIPLAPFLMVVGIVWVKSQEKLEEKRIAAGMSGKSEVDANHAREVADLKERVRVLERIVTNSGYDLASQIEALRDDRPAADLKPSVRDTLERTV